MYGNDDDDKVVVVYVIADEGEDVMWWGGGAKEFVCCFLDECGVVCVAGGLFVGGWRWEESMTENQG